MKKGIKITGVVVGLLVLAFAGLMIAYRQFKFQGVIESYDINQPSEKIQVLIVTQQSKFKDNVLNNMTTFFRDKPVYMKVVDATQVKDFETDQWDLVQILTVVESGNVQEDAARFLTGLADYQKVSLYLTADSGEWKNREIDIDAFTSASSNGNIEKFSALMIEEIITILE